MSGLSVTLAWIAAGLLTTGAIASARAALVYPSETDPDPRMRRLLTIGVGIPAFLTAFVLLMMILVIDAG